MPPVPLSLAVDVITPRDVNQGEHGASPDDPDYPWHFLAEGDSWFTIAAIPSSNLLFELRLGKYAQVLNLAYPGDTLRNIDDLARNNDLKRFLGKRNFCSRFDALLLSGGGNDLIGATPTLIRKKPIAKSDPALPASYIDDPALQELLDGIRAGYAGIVALRDSASSKSQGAPLFVHTYDYATPRNAPARFIGSIAIAGPWLFKAFAGSGLEIALQQRIADLLIDRLAETLLSLDSGAGGAESLPSFHVIDTRNTLVRANPTDVGNSNDWVNEIHPNGGGYRKIAARISAALNDVLLA